jgi:hypothetical protein
VSAALTLALLAATVPTRAGELQPLVVGWERIFSVTWQSAELRGRPVVEGRVENISPYAVTSIRVLVESLDAAGQVTAQRIAYVPGDLPGSGRVFFQVPIAQAPGYRVRVFSYDRIELDGPLR